ncbi:tape measure protein, partial [Patescibacteria group bacterium]|nr:tape measure protein [Patescibacteria group bacterium]
MPTEQINIVINEKGGRVVKRNIDSIGKSVDKTEKSVLSLNRVLGSLATTLGLRELIKISDTYTLINSRLKLVTDNTQQLIQAERQLFNIAQRNRAGFSQTVELYQRFSRTAKELGLSQNTLLRVTEAVNQAILISGASSQAANAALIQLGQGIAGAELRGQELNSVLEQTPRLAQAIATGLGVSVGKLRKIAAEGALTSKAVIGAILSQEKKLTEEFGRVNKTIGQSFTQLQNASIRFLGRSDNVATATLNIGKALDFLTGNLGAATNALIAFVGGLVIRQVILYTVSIGGLTGAFVALNTAIAANPLGLVLTGLTIAIAGLTLFADKIKLSKEGLTTIGDLGSVVGSRIADGFNTAKGAITPFFEDIFHLADGTFKDIDFSLKNLLLGFGTFGDALMGAMFVLGDFVLNLFDNLGPLIGESLKATFNAVVLSITAVINGLNSAVNVVIGGVNKLLKGFNNKLTGIDRIASKFASFIGLDIGAPLKIPGLELIEIPKLDPSDILTDVDFSFLGIDSGKAFKAGFETGAFSDPIKQAISDSEKNALKRDAKETGEEAGKALGDGVGVGLVSKGANVFADKVGDIFSRSITE